MGSAHKNNVGLLIALVRLPVNRTFTQPKIHGLPRAVTPLWNGHSLVICSRKLIEERLVPEEGDRGLPSSLAWCRLVRRQR